MRNSNSRNFLRRICLLAPMLLGLSGGQVWAEAKDENQPPSNLDGKPAKYAKLPNDQGWRIKKGRHQGKTLQRDRDARKEKGHGDSEWKLKDRKGKLTGNEFNGKGEKVKGPGDKGKKNKTQREAQYECTASDNEDTRSTSTCEPSNGPQVPISHVVGVVAVVAVCVLAPQLLPAVEVIEAVAANYLLFAQRLFEQ